MLYFGFRQPVAGGGGKVDSCPKTKSPSPDNQWSRTFIDGGRGLHAETAQAALTVILKLVFGGLTSVILTVFKYS